MNYLYIQKTRKYSQKGFVLLFTVLIASIILVITLGVSNSAFKETLLAASARDAHYAFFSADTGAECALYLDRITHSFVESPPAPAACNGRIVSISRTGLSDSFLYTFQLSLENGARCAKVSVDKKLTNETKIESLGYNTACDDTTSNLRIERALRVSY
jgi:hypothetical protein